MSEPKCMWEIFSCSVVTGAAYIREFIRWGDDRGDETTQFFRTEAPYDTCEMFVGTKPPRAALMPNFVKGDTVFEVHEFIQMPDVLSALQEKNLTAA